MTRNGRRAYGKVLLAACLFSCMATAQGEQEKVPPGSVAAELPALTAAAVDEARRLVQPSNDLRVDALLRALERRSLPYTVHRFPGIGAGDDPRPQGRNVIVTVGSGTPEVIVGAHIDAYRLPSVPSSLNLRVSAGLFGPWTSLLLLVWGLPHRVVAPCQELKIPRSYTRIFRLDGTLAAP